MSDEVPAICESCLGPNPYLQMLRERSGLECKLCTRPFTVYKWAQIKNGPFKHTMVCLTCAKQRNCCQSCLLDLTYGIPIQLRDAALKLAGVDGVGATEPKNEVTKLYVAGNSDKYESIGGAAVTSNKVKAREILEKLAHVKGNKVGKKLTQVVPQHIINTDVSKTVAKLPFNGSLEPPADGEIKTLFIFGIDECLPEYKITDYFEQFGKIKSFNCQHRARCGFLTFTRRVDCEAAVKSIKDTLVIESIPLRVVWGKERPLGVTSAEKAKIGVIVGKFMKKLGLKARSETGNVVQANSNTDVAKDGTKVDYSKVLQDYEF